MPFLQLRNQPGHRLGRAVDVAKETDFSVTSRCGQCHRDLQLRGIQADVDFAILMHGSSSLCVRLGAGRSSATLARRILRDEPPLENEHTVCQVAVFAVLTDGARHTPVDLRLYLPQCWIKDPARCDRAELPTEARTMRSKTDLALEMVRAARGMRFGWVGVDGGYSKPQVSWD